MPTLARVLWVPVVRTWGRLRRSRVDFELKPADGTAAHAAGSNADRILVFGSGPAVGWGVRSQDLALPGCLARAVGVLTGRGADVDLIADMTITIDTAVQHIAAVDLQRYDAIVIVLGLGDALQLTSVARWSRGLAHLIEHLVEVVPRFTPIVVTGIAGVWNIPAYNTMLGRLAQQHAANLERVTEQSCAISDRVTFVPLSPATTEQASTRGFGVNYRTWAGEIAAVVVPPLNIGRRLTARNSAGRLRDRAGAEIERGEMVRKLGVLDAAPSPELDQIIKDVRRAFGTSGAALVVMDADTLWVVAQTGGLPSHIPLRGSFAEALVTHRGAFVVPDALADDHFRELPVVTGTPNLRFWAGFPIETQTGVRIGALSVFDAAPRDPDTNSDRSLLRHFGLKAQDALNFMASRNNGV